ncbi:MAG: DUF3303 family protein [Anaerolineales bacterium]
MSLYFVRHEHAADTCPARDPEKGQMLLDHISPQNARQFGIDVQGEAVLDNHHTFVLIVDAADETSVENFMSPFKQAGVVEIWPASQCETVVERLGC